MPDSQLPLFIYGTLHPDRAPEAIAPIARLLRSIGKATIQGRLYDLGDYPGVLLGNSASEIVHGELFFLPENDSKPKMLARLDAYEDYRPHDPESSLFLRECTIATLEDGLQRPCWVYTYNHLLL